MEIGIFARTFARETYEEILDTVLVHEIDGIQFNTLCIGLSDMPDALDDALITGVRAATVERGITMQSISGTYNMIHPDPAERADGLRRLGVMMGACDALGTSIITLCTGTRNTESMWRPHPDNHSAQAWRDLVTEVEKAVTMADDHGVLLAFEPEVANVIDSAPKARKLLDEIRSPNLKVVFDGANIHHKGELPNQHRTISEAVELLGDDIIMAHAKDLDRDGEAGHLAAGTGLLDYDHYLGCLREIEFMGPIQLHGLSEDQVPECVAFLREKLGR